MLRKILISRGIVAPVLYVNAVSELLSNGAPNKAVLDITFNIYNALLLAFAI